MENPPPLKPDAPTNAKDGHTDEPMDARGTYGQSDFSPAARKSEAQTEQETNVPHLFKGKFVTRKGATSGS
jgi:hypothetical protein